MRFTSKKYPKSKKCIIPCITPTKLSQNSIHHTFYFEAVCEGTILPCIELLCSLYSVPFHFSFSWTYSLLESFVEFKSLYTVFVMHMVLGYFYYSCYISFASPTPPQHAFLQSGRWNLKLLFFSPDLQRISS